MAEAAKCLILNGPNLNLLGTREPETYGRTTLAEIEQQCHAAAGLWGLTIDFEQSNSEGRLVDLIQAARADCRGIIINAGAYTHTSVAIMDALLAVDLTVIELHLSNTFRREAFRHHSYLSQAATGIICGFGAAGYRLAIEAMAGLLGLQRKD